MKFHLPLNLRRILFSLLLPVAGVSLSLGTDLFENSEETLSFNNNSRRFAYDLNSSDPPTLLLSFQNNQAIEFLNNSIEEDDGGVISVVPDGTGSRSTGLVAFSGNAGPITFMSNTTTNSGGAIAGGWLGLTFENNLGEIRFESNRAGSKGGAIFGQSGNEFTFRDNNNIIFLGNQTTNIDDLSQNKNTDAKGGAIYTFGSVQFDGNNQVLFTGNNSQSAGAIYAAELSISNTKEEVRFDGNHATGELWQPEDAHGGALYVYADGDGVFHFDITNNARVVFENNTATGSGGAIALHGVAPSNKIPVFQENGALSFLNNSSGNEGGAIYSQNNNSLVFQGNETISFEGNTAKDGGGAIFTTSISITENQTVSFTGNNAGTAGGAICADGGTVSIVNNDTVEFRGNYVKQYDEDGNLIGAVLNSMDSGNLELSTKADGGTITFYDPITGAESDSYNLNRYQDSEGNPVTGTGAIVFSGLHAEEDLTAIFQTLGLEASGETFQSCLEKSLTSSIEVGGDFTLHGGSLEVRDGAVLNLLGSTSVDDVHYVAKAGSLTELSDNGTLNIETDAMFEAGAELRIIQSGMTAGRDFTSSGYAYLNQGTLNIGRNAVLEEGGWIELQHESSVTGEGAFTVRDSSSVTFNGNGNSLNVTGNVDFQAGSSLEHYYGTGSTLTAPSVAMTGADLQICPQNEGYALTVDGDLSLTDATIWITSGGLQGRSSADGFDLKGIDVTGALTVSGAATINLDSAFENREGVLTLFQLNGEGNFTGNISDWTLQSWTETYDDGSQTWTDTFNPLENGKLTAAYLSDGKWGILLTLAGGAPPTPDEEDIYVYTGEEKSITDLSKRVHLLGGTLDVTGLPQDMPLTNQVLVEGTDGLLVMNEGQSLILTGTLTGEDEIGYDINGINGGSAGGVVIGNSSGSLDSGAVDLAGERYNIASLNVRGGLAGIEETASLGHADTNIIVGSGRDNGDNAALINDGAIQGSTLTVNSDGAVTNNNTLNVANITLNGHAALANTRDLTANEITVAEDAFLRNTKDGLLEVKDRVTLRGNMSNDGQITGLVMVQNGGVLSGGGAFDSVTVQQDGRLNIQGAASFNGLILEEGSGMAFAVNGTTPFNAGMSVEETYSHATVEALSLTGTPVIEVRIGSGLIASGTETFTLNLLEAKAHTGDVPLGQDQLLLTGETGLLEGNGGELIWNPETGLLTFSGKVNTTAAAGLAGGDAALLADTLWSSVSSVASFARTAAEQGKLAGVRSSRLWGAGLGHFTSMSSMDSLSGFSYKGGGYAVGSDVAVGDNAVAGVSFGQMFGTHKSDNSLLSDKQRSFMFALYGNMRQELARGHELNISGYFSYGSVDHTARTHVGGSSQTPGRASWDDNVYAFGLLADWGIKAGDSLTVAPFTGITYMYGTQGAIEETFDGGSRSFGNGGMQSWSIPVGVTLKSVCKLGNGQALLPELSVAYVGDIARRNPYTRTWAAGQTVTGKGHNPGRNALMTRVGLGWQINRNWQAGAWYTLEVRSGQTNQSVNLNASYSF